MPPATLVAPLSIGTVSVLGLSIPESGLCMGGEVELGLAARLGMERGLLSLLGLGAYVDTELG